MKSKSTRSRIESTLHSKSRRHYLMLGAILLVAALFRFWNLSGMPTGLHGDEGIVGYEARRILQEGSIGPYSPASFGQPSGPIYFAALSQWLLGESIFSIRVVSAIAGLLGVLALYGLIRQNFGKNAALIGSFVLATLYWHVHFAHIAFPVECWPLSCILIAWVTLKAVKTQDWRWWAFAGFMNGTGVYVYKAHPLFFVLTMGFAAIQLFSVPIPWHRKASLLALYGVFALIAANFLIRYALDPLNAYGNHFELFSVFNKPEYLQRNSEFSKAFYLVARYFRWWKMAVFVPIPDRGDAAGLVPLVSAPIFLLAIVGLFARKKNFEAQQWPIIYYSRIIVLLMPISSVVTLEAFARRTFALAPFLCVLAAAGAVQIIQFGNKHRMAGRIMAPAFVSLLLTVGAIQGWRDYFRTFAHHPYQGGIFCQELTQSLDYMKSLPKGTPIYFYSQIWSITYDTRKYLAPDLNAVDCSKEFSAYHQLIFPSNQPKGKIVWVFMAPYQNEYKHVMAQFPGGKVIKGPDNLRGLYSSYMAYEIN